MTPEIWIDIGLILLLVLLSGFFSGSETALTAASRAVINRLAQDGNVRATRIAELIEDRERLIGGVLLGNNIVNILASAIATALLISIFGEEGVVYATLVMTALILVFAEVLPKSYAISNPERVALSVGPTIGFVVSLFSPVVALVSRIVRGTLRIFGIDISKSEPVLSAHEEIRGTIDLTALEGGIDKGDQDMLESILDLEEVLVEDIMVHRKNMIMLDIDQPAEALLKAAVKSSLTRLPLWQGEPENIVGVLHVKDILQTMARRGFNPKRLNFTRIARKPWFVPETTTLRDQLNAFLDRRAHFAIVVDEYGGLQGLISLEDILEEIVGDIADEHDALAEGVRELPDGSLIMDGTVTIRDLNRQFDWELPDDEAATIAGLVLHEAEVIPEVGATYYVHGFEVEVMARRRNQLTKLKLVKV